MDVSVITTKYFLCYMSFVRWMLTKIERGVKIELTLCVCLLSEKRQRKGSTKKQDGVAKVSASAKCTTKIEQEAAHHYRY
jgi:hypothetical protein